MTRKSENTVGLDVAAYLKDDCVAAAVGATDNSTAEGSSHAGTYFGDNEQFIRTLLTASTRTGVITASR